MALGSPDPAKVREVVAQVTYSFNAYSETVEDGISDFAESMAGIANDSIGLIRVSADFPAEVDDADVAKSALIELLSNMSSTATSMEEFAGSVRGL